MDEFKEQCRITQPCLSLPQMHDAVKPSLHLQRENYIHATQVLKTDRCRSKISELFDPKLEDHSKQLLNLHFPADGYVNDDFNRIDNRCMFEPFCRVQDNSASKCDAEIDAYVPNGRDEVGCSNYSHDEKASDVQSSFSHEHEEIHACPDGNSTLAIQSYCNDFPCLDFNNSELTNSLFGRLPSFSSLKTRPEIEYIPIVIQALPCFPASYRLKTRNRKPKVSKNKDKLVTENTDLGAVTKFKIRISKTKLSKNSTDASVIENSNIGKMKLGIQLPSYESVDSLAADILVDMSTSAALNIDHQSCDSLTWLVNVISSELPNDDYDRFETSTLKLREMKQEEYNINSSLHKGKENKMGVTNSVTKKCKKHAKKFRKNKNFQKDILPSIVRLSRKEVKEDFHAFDCLMRSIGETLNAKILNKNHKKKKNVEFKKQEKNFVGWGKKTRRGPRTRVKLGNITLVF